MSLSALGDGVSYARRFGVRPFLRHARYTLANGLYDRRLGVDTGGMVEKSSLEVEKPDSIDYVPIGYGALTAVMRAVLQAEPARVFLDLGAGKGRALVVAATFPFERVIGVELSQRLTEQARENLAGMRGRRARSVEVHCADATEFAIPDDVDLLYCFNPFVGADLQRVADNLRASYDRRPRRLRVVYFNDGVFEKLVAGETWLMKSSSSSCYQNLTLGLYETRP